MATSCEVAPLPDSIDGNLMKIWSDVEYVYRCLADKARTEAFQKAIAAAVKPGDVVLDLGAGSGIMALFAIRAGASRVYAVEIGGYLALASRRIFEENGCDSKAVSLEMDARAINLTHVEKPDVVICEMLTTGLIGEMQGSVIGALKKSGVIDARTRLVPAGLSTSVALVRTDWTFYGETVRFPLFVDYFTRSFERSYELISRERTAHSVDFVADFTDNVRVKETLHVTDGERINGILLTSVTRFGGGDTFENGVSYCQPVILPTRDHPVSRGDVAEVAIDYRMSEGFDSLSYEIRIVT